MLYPGLIKAQARSVNTILKADNTALMAAREKINDFLNADMLKGEAWDDDDSYETVVTDQMGHKVIYKRDALFRLVVLER